MCWYLKTCPYSICSGSTVLVHAPLQLQHMELVYLCLSSCPCPSPAPPPALPPLPLFLQEQYVFIHRALREYLLLGYSMLPGSELRSKVEEMSPVKRHSGVSRFQEQYEVW